MSDLRALIESDELLFGSAIVSHGYAPHFRDYDIMIDVPAALPDGVPMRGVGTYIMGRYRYQFTHCPECHVTTAVGDEAWRQSWADVFTDYAAWEAAGNPEGFVWGVNWAEAYPGLSYVSDSSLASSWTERMGCEMHEIAVETNTFVLRLVAAGLEIRQVAVGDALTGEMNPVDAP